MVSELLQPGSWVITAVMSRGLPLREVLEAIALRVRERQIKREQ